ncbi:MAG: antitoxin [Dermatophilaceae bacterium]
MSTITENLKSKLDELDLDRRLDELTRATEVAVKKAVAHAGDLAHDNREKVATLLDKAGAVIDEKTDGKYRDQFDKVRTQVVTGVDKLAAKRPAAAAADADDLARATDEGMPPADAHRAAGSDSANSVDSADVDDLTGSPWADAPVEKPSKAAWSEHTDTVE